MNISFNGKYGFVALNKILSLARYEEFLAKAYHADMLYLAKHKEQKATPQSLLKTANSAIVFQKHYEPHPKTKDLPIGLKIASYALGEDYHHWFKEELQIIADDLKRQFPDEEFLCFTDSAPVLERELALRAGLGWIGKNACLIDEKTGSFFFIGEIYTSLDLTENKQMAPDRCGTCTRCIDACPTGAIKEDRFIDSSLCISYQTIEAKQTPPEDLRNKLNGWHFGCDICQEVCPWNEKAFGKEHFKQKHDKTKQEILDSHRWILTASNREIERTFKGTALLRASAKHHRRNALISLVHYQLTELLPEVRAMAKRFTDLEDLCHWVCVELEQH